MLEQPELQPEPDDSGTPLVEPIDLSAEGRRYHPMREILRPDERAELDQLLPQLPPSQVAFVRIIEIFMMHELNQAATFNGEVRSLLAEQGRRLETIEAASNPAVITGMHAEMAVQTEAISTIGTNLVRLVGDVRDHGRRIHLLEGARGRVSDLGPFGD